MTTPRIFPLIAALALSLVALAPVNSLAAVGLDSPAAQFVQKLGDKALTSLTDKDLPAQERSKRVRSLLREQFDIQTIGRFALGTYWRVATDSQRTQYFSLFEDMIVQTYTQRFADYSGQSFKVTNVVAPEEGSRDSIVRSVIVQNNAGPDINIDWRVRDKSGQMKIVDVLVDSISMSVTQRSDFDSVIQHGGGNVEALLVSLQNHK